MNQEELTDSPSKSTRPSPSPPPAEPPPSPPLPPPSPPLPPPPPPTSSSTDRLRSGHDHQDRKTLAQCEICHSPCKPIDGSTKVKCLECQAQERQGLIKEQREKSSVKLKKNLIYERLENFYSTFKLKKKIAMQQKWLNEAPTKSCKVQRLQCVENTTRRLLWKFGAKLVDHPSLIIIVPLLLCALASLGVIVNRKNLEFQAPFSLLYSQSADEISVRTTFNFTNPKYNALQRFSSSQFAVILKTVTDDNILTDDTIEKYLRLKEKIESIRLSTDNGKFLKYDTICTQVPRGSCTHDIMETLVSMDKSMRLQYPETQVPLANKNSTSSLYLGDKIGGVVVDHDGYLNSAESMAMYFKLAPKFQREFEKWDSEFRRVMTSENNLKPMKFTWWSFGGFQKAFVELMYSIFIHLSWSAVIILVLSIITFVKCSQRTSHPLLGAVSTVVIVTTVASGISVDLGISGAINPTSFPCYFLVAASMIFVVINLFQSWRKYSNFEISSKQKFCFLMCWEMPGFVNVCVLSFASFAMCAICTSLPLFQRQCQFMAACSLFALILILFAYCGILYLSGNREKSGLKWYRMPLKQKNSQDIIKPSHQKPVQAQITNNMDRLHYVSCFVDYHDKQRYQSKDVESLHKSLLNLPSNAWCSTIEMVCSGWFRYVSFLLFIVYVIFAIWGCSVADVSFNEDDYLRQNDNLHEFLDDYKHYYGTYSSYMELIFDGYVDYYNPKIRRAIADMISYVEFDIRGSDKSVSWLKDFNEFEQTVVNLINKDSFVGLVNFVFLRDQRYKTYTNDIQTSPNGEQILATRMYIRLNDIGLSRRVEIAKSLLSQAKSFNLPLKIKLPASFMLAHDVAIEWNSVETFLILILMLTVFSLILFAQPFLTFNLVICITSTSIGSVGYAALWDVPANAFSVGTVLAGTMYTTLICSMFCYLYNNANDCGPMLRLFYSFSSVFRAILLSCIITLVSFSPMLTIESEYIVQQMKLILCHLVISAIHCLLFLPTLMYFYNTNVLAFWRYLSRTLKNVCRKRDFTKHVYYVPMSQRKLIVDPLYVQKFFNEKFREDITKPMIQMNPPREIMNSPEHHIRSTAVGHHAREPENHHGPLGSPMKSQSKVYRYSSNAVDPMEDFIRSRGVGPSVKHRPTIGGYKGYSPKSRSSSSTENVSKMHSSEEDPYIYEPMAMQKIGSPRSRSADNKRSSGFGDHWDKPKNKLSYSKWTKEIPIDGRRMERVVAERYTLEADGDDVNLQTKWEKFLTRQGDRAPFMPQGTVARAPKLSRRPFPVPNSHFSRQPFVHHHMHGMKFHGAPFGFPPVVRYPPAPAKMHNTFSPSFHHQLPPTRVGPTCKPSPNVINKPAMHNISKLPSSAWY